MAIERIFPTAIDNSMRKELVKCETAVMYRYEAGLRSPDQSRVDLHAGGAFAKGMEVMRKAFYITDANSADALNEGIQALYQAYGGFVPPPKSNKTAERMAGALAFFQQECPIESDPLVPVRFPNGEYGIEVGFNFPIPIDHPQLHQELTYCGRFDKLAQHKDTGDYWVVDEKTTSQMGEKWANQWPLDSQMTGYCWGANKLLEQHGLNARVKGAVINGIAIRLRDYEHGFFHAIRPDWMIDRWYQQMLTDVRRWKAAFVSGQHDQALDHACAYYNNPCEFAALCMAKNPERLIEGSYIVSRWNPLTREES